VLRRCRAGGLGASPVARHLARDLLQQALADAAKALARMALQDLSPRRRAQGRGSRRIACQQIACAASTAQSPEPAGFARPDAAGSSPTRVATTGSPASMASCAVMQKPSFSDVWT
jgi:hypothetical protein